MSTASTTPDSPNLLDTTQPISPLVAAARAQFLADFPRLLAHREADPDYKWVAYHGSNRIGIGASKAQLVRICHSLEIPTGEFLILGIDPATADPNG